MDTRFWGPSGWKLIHLVAQESAHTGCHASAVLEWFQLLEYILPCKYCRASFHDYIRLQPLTLEIIMDTERFNRWAYDIHNRVNDKLRGQGLLTTPNPSWAEIRDQYRTLHDGLCKGTPLLGWDFMTSVAYSTPASDYKPIPMPDTPELDAAGLAALSFAERNRYNLLTREERLSCLKRWWGLIPSILPCAVWRTAWAGGMKKAGPPPLRRGRDVMTRWMWRIEEGVCADLRCPTPHRSFPALRHEVSAFESGCGVAKKGKTCRTRRKRQRSRIQSRRQKRGVAVL
jgi:hypothetical protein